MNFKTVHIIKQVDKPISDTGQAGKFKVRDMITKCSASEQNNVDLKTRDLDRQLRMSLKWRKRLKSRQPCKNEMNELIIGSKNV